MNDLNYLLLSGSVDGIKGKGSEYDPIRFNIATKRHESLSLDPYTQTFPVVVLDSRISGVLKNKLTDGRKIRVVGRLAIFSAKPTIVAEHIELLPNAKC